MLPGLDPGQIINGRPEAARAARNTAAGDIMPRLFHAVTL
jgi:hypothetical protein